MTGTFACPFYRKDPFRHMDCVNYTLTRFSDVKQHLQRRHQDHFIIRCPLCNESFDSFAERDKHANSSASFPCSPSLEHAQSGLEQNPHSKLKARSSPRVAPSEMYFDLWDTLFDKETRPSNPYRGPVFLETIAALRDFWETEKWSIITNIINGCPQLLIMEEQLFSPTLMNIFDRLLTRFEDFVRDRCSVTRAVQIPALTGHLDEPKADLDVGEPYPKDFKCRVDPKFNQGIELFGNQLPNPEYPTSLAPQIHYQDLAASANNGTLRVLETSTSSADDALNEDQDYQASGEASIGAFLQGDPDSEFSFGDNNVSYFDCY
ncbi:unnamed protein product [Clonostachys byssicola]|uniref:C2H2-type domain-containing protein n=1 Tax=Clonostachys byssicola TaxID=160290 RepID=A0A9N9U6F1_9HYPO|nr:unnamed protein product [Clonostachys byssicola]